MGRLGAEESNPHEDEEASAAFLAPNAEEVAGDNGFDCTEPPSPGVYTDQGEFLRAIHVTFLDLVQPIQSGLTDELRSVGAIDVDGEEEIMAEKTTRDKARTLWHMLHLVPPRLFGEKCMPILKTLYSHVLEGAEYRWDRKPDLASTCLRHAIMTRMTIKRFADVFPSTTDCSLQEYKNILENKSTGEDLWKPVFCLVKQNRTNEKLVERLLHTLEGIGVDRQGDRDWLKRQLESGLSCTCISKLQEEGTATNDKDHDSANDMTDSADSNSATGSADVALASMDRSGCTCDATPSAASDQCDSLGGCPPLADASSALQPSTSRHQADRAEKLTELGRAVDGLSAAINSQHDTAMCAVYDLQKEMRELVRIEIRDLKAEFHQQLEQLCCRVKSLEADNKKLKSELGDHNKIFTSLRITSPPTKKKKRRAKYPSCLQCLG